MADAPLQFYEQFAEVYHYIFADWQASVLLQAGALDEFIRKQHGPPPLRLLDCTCGVGTQALGLAAHGYTVHATDLSPAAVDKARTYAQAFDADLTFGVADIRALESQVEGTFDVVLSCDNAVAHLLDDADLLLATRQMAAKLRPGGMLLVSMRDYDHLVEEKPRATPPSVSDTADGRRIAFQVWDWLDDGRAYDLSQFITRQEGQRWETICLKTRLRALLRSEFIAALHHAGLVNIVWHMPAVSGYYQPIVTAHKSTPRAIGEEDELLQP